jgi:peptide/nickel transport system permease protein
VKTLILSRLAQLVLVLLAVSFLSFSAMNVLGDPLFNIVGPLAELDCDAVARGEIESTSSSLDATRTDCEIVAEVKAEFRLDEPLMKRYVLWLADSVRGDFGTSFVSEGVPVSEILKEKFPASIKLMIYAEVIALGLAIPLGVYGAYRANRRSDQLLSVVSFGALAVPNFALGIVLLYVFGLRTGWFPTSYDSSSIWGEVKSLFLPALTLGSGLAAGYQRLLRTDLVTTLQEDFIHMARAKGMTDRHIMFRHALRPSLFSVITVFGVQTGALIGGSLVVEQIYLIPGVGRELVTAVVRDDFPVVLAGVTIIATAFVVINFAVDLLYGWLDPRVRTQS